MQKRSSNKWLFVCLLCLSWHLGLAQTHAARDSTRWNLFTYDMGNMFQGAGFALSRPVQWRKKQWVTFAAVAVGTGIVYIFDDNTSEFLANQRESVPELIREYGDFYGSPQHNYLFTGGVYLSGLAIKNEKLRRSGVLLLSSATAAGLMQHFTKSLIGRARPVSGRTKDTFRPFSGDRDFHSFPSGHTLLAFTNAYAIAKHFKNPWLKAGIYTIGVVPGISRIWDRQHWVSDFALGLAVSIFTVEAVDRYLDRKYEEKYNNDEEREVSWDLRISPGSLGLAVRF